MVISKSGIFATLPPSTKKI